MEPTSGVERRSRIVIHVLAITTLQFDIMGV
jgi:hypothetical protein